jgi:hypothetical protein
MLYQLEIQQQALHPELIYTPGVIERIMASLVVPYTSTVVGLEKAILKELAVFGVVTCIVIPDFVEIW